MANKKKEVPKHIQEYYDKSQSIENIINSTTNAHSQAYLEAAKLLVSKDGKNTDYTKLEDKAFREQFIDKLLDSYISFAEQQSGTKANTEFEKEILLQKYVGITRAGLSEVIHEAKSKYSIQVHENIRKNLVEKQTKELAPLASSHLKEEHIEDILKHTGTAEYLNKDVLEIGKAAMLLGQYKANGELTLSNMKAMKNDLGGDAYFKKDTLEAIKKLKDNYKKAA